MNKNIDLRKNTTILFILNLCVLISLIIFRIYFSKVGYSMMLVNAMLVINIIILIIGTLANIYFLRKPLQDNKNSIIIMIAIFIIYMLFNTVVVFFINKSLDASYVNVANRLSKYCDDYVCDRYQTIRDGKIRDFIVNKSYFDYDGVQNYLEIHTKYDSKEVISVQAIIYSQNELFSETLIKEQIKGYYDNFKVEIDETLIREAFNKRLDGEVQKDNLTYKVNEIYEKEELVRLKTVITLILKQE